MKRCEIWVPFNLSSRDSRPILPLHILHGFQFISFVVATHSAIEDSLPPFSISNVLV
jgi:hypothetical protein